MTSNWKNIRGHNKEKYQLYLCSEEWGALRTSIRERAKGKCEHPGCLNDGSHTHHLTYIRRYQENPEDLQLLCELHHDKVHGREPKDDREFFKKYAFVKYRIRRIMQYEKELAQQEAKRLGLSTIPNIAIIRAMGKLANGVNARCVSYHHYEDRIIPLLLKYGIVLSEEDSDVVLPLPLTRELVDEMLSYMKEEELLECMKYSLPRE